MSFLSNLLKEVLTNGKTMLGVVLMQIPQVSSFPGLSTAIKTAATDHTPASFIDLGIQALMVLGATLQAKKVVVNAVNKS